jgi:hypothetical protein
MTERRASYLALAAEYRALAESGTVGRLTGAYIKIAEGYEALAESTARDDARYGGRSTDAPPTP